VLYSAGSAGWNVGGVGDEERGGQCVGLVVFDALAVGGEWYVEGQENDYHDGEVPGDEGGGEGEAVVTPEVGVVVEEAEDEEEEAGDLD